jgi:type II secretory pathway component PulF
MSLPHATIAVFYQQLGQQLAVGLTLAQALRTASPAPADDTARLAAQAEAGEAVANVIAGAGDWLPREDRPFLIAAAASGRLPAVLDHLAKRHERLAATRRRIVLASLYPAGVFHFAALILPFLRMIDFEKGLSGGVAAYCVGVAWILVPAWTVFFVIRWLAGRRNPAVLAMLDRLPAIGHYRRNQALADFSFALGLLLESGVSIGLAWRTAGDISRSPRLDGAARRIEAVIEQGESPGAHLRATGVFDPTFMARYQTGELTGGLESAMLALAADHQAEAERGLARASLLYPGLLFAAVIAMVGYTVISFALRYAKMITDMTDGL